MSEVNIRLILEKHKKWLHGEKGGERANLRGADLGGANLRGADLGGAYLGGAYLWRANLRGADLGGGAYLGGANLGGAYLRGANLRGANLRGAYLEVKHPPINSHCFIAEILFRESKDFKERSWAGSIEISTDWCWNDFFINCPKSMIVWAKKILCGKWKEFEEKFK